MLTDKDIKEILDRHGVEQSEELSAALEEIFSKTVNSRKFSDSIVKKIEKDIRTELRKQGHNI